MGASFLVQRKARDAETAESTMEVHKGTCPALARERGTCGLGDRRDGRCLIWKTKGRVCGHFGVGR